MSFFVVFLCFILYLFVKNGWESKKTKEDEFTTAISALNGIVEAHVQTIFEERIGQLRSKFDLKAESQTNSSNQFVNAFDDLCNQTTKIIIKTYLSESLLRTLLKYYKIEGLTLFILSILRKR